MGAELRRSRTIPSIKSLQNLRTACTRTRCCRDTLKQCRTCKRGFECVSTTSRRLSGRPALSPSSMCKQYVQGSLAFLLCCACFAYRRTTLAQAGAKHFEAFLAEMRSLCVSCCILHASACHIPSEMSRVKLRGSRFWCVQIQIETERRTSSLPYSSHPPF